MYRFNFIFIAFKSVLQVYFDPRRNICQNWLESMSKWVHFLNEYLKFYHFKKIKLHKIYWCCELWYPSFFYNTVHNMREIMKETLTLLSAKLKTIEEFEFLTLCFRKVWIRSKAFVDIWGEIFEVTFPKFFSLNGNLLSISYETLISYTAPFLRQGQHKYFLALNSTL